VVRGGSEHGGIWFNRRDEHSPVWLATGMARVSFSHFCDDPSCS
jgi:hypothetical protein